MEKGIKRMAWHIILLTLFVTSSVLGNSAYAFEFRGFGDINYADAKNEAAPASDSKIAAFRQGQLSLHAHGDLGEDLDAVTEVFITSSGIGIARLYIGYRFDELLGVRAGKWHKPIGYWNTAYHHGTLLQTTIEAPLVVKVGSTIVPIHETGLWAIGTYNTEPLRLDYGVTVTNGQGGTSTTSTGITGIGGSNDTSDINTNKAILLYMRAHPSAIPALGIGISGNFDKIQSFGSTSALTLDVSQQIYSVDLQFINQQIEFLAEHFYFNEKDDLAKTGTFKSAGSYVQLGYTIANRYIPYARYERISVREADPIIKNGSMSDQQKALAGLRYNMTANSALKGEFQHIDPTDPVKDSYWKFAAQ
jgi:hypothetical protein